MRHNLRTTPNMADFSSFSLTVFHSRISALHFQLAKNVRYRVLRTVLVASVGCTSYCIYCFFYSRVQIGVLYYFVTKNLLYACLSSMYFIKLVLIEILQYNYIIHHQIGNIEFRIMNTEYRSKISDSLDSLVIFSQRIGRP